MRYGDHLQKVTELQQEIARLKKHPIEQEDVILYLIESAEGFLLAAKTLIEIRIGEKKEKDVA